MTPLSQQAVIQRIVQAYPETQAIYLFGTWGTADQWPQSDIDVAILLPPEKALGTGWEELFSLSLELAAIAGTDNADLINLRRVDTVFRTEIIMANRRIHCVDETAAIEFEALTLSLYQQLQAERKEIIESALRSGRFRHA